MSSRLTVIVTMSIATISTTRQTPKGAQPITFAGTGPYGATLEGGLVEAPTAEKPTTAAITEQPKKKLNLQGHVLKSVVCHDLDNTDILLFKGKIPTAVEKHHGAEKKIEQNGDDEKVDINVACDVRMSVVSITLKTNGISFIGED